LNNSLAYSDDELWPYTKDMLFNPCFPFVGVESLTTFWCLWHDFLSRYARKSIKGTKDSWDSLVSKQNLSETIGILDWRPGPRKLDLD